MIASTSKKPGSSEDSRVCSDSLSKVRLVPMYKVCCKGSFFPLLFKKKTHLRSSPSLHPPESAPGDFSVHIHSCLSKMGAQKKHSNGKQHVHAFSKPFRVRTATPKKHRKVTYPLKLVVKGGNFVPILILFVVTVTAPLKIRAIESSLSHRAVAVDPQRNHGGSYQFLS